MQVEISDEFTRELKTLTTLKPKGRDLDFIVDWFVRIGMGTAKAVLEKHPELTFGDLVTKSFHDDYH
jgi:hypothetical protein